MEKVKLRDIDLTVGEPLEYDIFDARGWMLLNREFVIATETQIARLLERGAYGTRPEVEASRTRRGLHADKKDAPEELVEISVFDRVTWAKSGLDACLSDPGAPDAFPAKVLGIAKALQQCVDLDPDVAIANIFLNRSQRYSVRHAVNAALMCELLGRTPTPDCAARLPAVCAALTMNMTIMELEDELHEQSAAGSEAQELTVASHPSAAEARLRELGVTDPEWLLAVEQHHERRNGSGYPQGLYADSILPAAQTLAVADEFCAIVAHRANCPAALPNAALRKLFVDRQGLDAALGSVLLREIGIYPPGTLVRLKNGDLAMVVRRTRNAHQPVVRALVNANRRTLDGYPKRLTSKQVFAIDEVLALKKLGNPLDHNEQPLQIQSLWDSTSAALGEDAELDLAQDAMTR